MIYKISGAVAIITLCTLCTTNVAADPAFDSDAQSKVSRYRASQRLEWAALDRTERQFRFREKGRSGFASSPDETPCGAIDLGTLDKGAVSQSARSVTVIIDGDVINANNRCR